MGSKPALLRFEPQCRDDRLSCFAAIQRNEMILPLDPIVELIAVYGVTVLGPKAG